MAFYEDLKGVLLTPPFYAEFEDVYLNQRDHLLSNPDDTFTEAPLSTELGRDLHEERVRPSGEAIMAYYGISNLRREADILPPLSGVGVDPGDVRHLIEALHRQAKMLETSAIECRGTIEGFAAEAQASRKLALARALQEACVVSEYKRIPLPTKYALGHQPARVTWKSVTNQVPA